MISRGSLGGDTAIIYYYCISLPFLKLRPFEQKQILRTLNVKVEVDDETGKNTRIYKS